MTDYERIEQLILYLQSHRAEQPDLSRLAEVAGLSPFYLQRLFSAWAGISPKAFLKCLTTAHAKQLLRNGHAVLDTAFQSGLSGPGRLHDMCVTLEAASPGEIKSGGLGWVIQLGISETPFGRCLLAESPRGICHLSFLDATYIGQDTMKKAAERVIARDWPQAEIQWNQLHIDSIAAHVFAHPASDRTPITLKAWVRGSEFQVRVWRALLAIPRGVVVSYGDLAEAVGNSSAARAVGSAVAQNQIAVLIPCHRVIRQTGVIGDYRWGSVRKQAILARECAPR